MSLNTTASCVFVSAAVSRHVVLAVIAVVDSPIALSRADVLEYGLRALVNLAAGSEANQVRLEACGGCVGSFTGMVAFSLGCHAATSPCVWNADVVVMALTSGIIKVLIIASSIPISDACSVDCPHI